MAVEPVKLDDDAMTLLKLMERHLNEISRNLDVIVNHAGIVRVEVSNAKRDDGEVPVDSRC